MNKHFLKVAMGLFLSATALIASAQKTYKEGVITYNVSTGQGDIETKTYFNRDSSASVFAAGPAEIKTLSTNKGDYVAVLVSVPSMQIKKAGVGTPAEIEDYKKQNPNFTFTPTTETKQIAGYNCKKVTAKDAKGASYDIWITTDIVVPENMMTQYLSKAGGFPIQFVTVQQGQAVNITFKSIVEQKAPAGTFVIPKDYDKISLTELRQLGGGGQ